MKVGPLTVVWSRSLRERQRNAAQTRTSVSLINTELEATGSRAWCSEACMQRHIRLTALGRVAYARASMAARG